MFRPIPTLFTCCLLLGLLSACQKRERDYYDGLGKRPVYISANALLDIRNEPPQAIHVSGTIFLRDTLLFLLEQGKGIHVFDIKDSSNTINLAFFKIPAVTDFVIAGNVLYADSWRDLVVIDISDLQAIQLSDRIPNVINPVLYPPLYDGAFECVDESKGAVIDWEDATLDNAKCITTN